MTNNKYKIDKIFLYLKNFLKDNKIEALESECRQLLKSGIKYPFVYNFLGMSLSRQEKYRQSIDPYLKACEADENNPNILSNISFSYFKVNDYVNARTYSEKSLKVDLLNLVAHRIYIETSKGFDLYDMRLFYIEKILKKEIADNKILFNLSVILFEKKQFLASLKLLRKIKRNIFKKKTKLENSNILAIYHLIAKILIINNKVSSIFYLYRCSQINPKNVIYQKEIAEYYRLAGNFLESKKTYDLILKKNNEEFDVYYKLSSIIDFSKDFDFTNGFLIKLKRILKNNNLKNIDKIFVKFSLGKLYEDIKDFKNAFKYYSEANALKDSNYSNIDTDKIIFDNIKELYKKVEQTNLNRSALPIFIIGLPRSGSTILENIISKNHNVKALGETNQFGNFLENYFSTKDLVKFKQEFNNINDGDILNFRNNFINSFGIKGKYKYFVDKTLFNFIYVGLIKTLLPDSKIIFTSRDYKDIFVSIYKNYFPDSGLTFAYSEKKILDYITFYNIVKNYWHNFLKNDYLEVSYEKLVSNDSSELIKIENFLDIKIDHIHTSNQNDKKKLINTLSVSQARKDLYKSSIKNWRNFDNSFNNFYELLDKLN